MTPGQWACLIILIYHEICLEFFFVLFIILQNSWNVFPVKMNPILAVELLFFAIFGQTTHEQFKVQSGNQPSWTTAFFKLAFGIYMLVSVVVLINLLIAMMSDTYQRIQAQSDIEWKYGLSKLIRNMHRYDWINPNSSHYLKTFFFFIFYA